MLTDQPLASVLRSPTASRRMVKLAMELTQYGLEYKPRPGIKAQALADFIVECMATGGTTNLDVAAGVEGWWEMCTNGAARSRHCGGGVMLTSLEGFKTYNYLVYKFKTSNNGAEYEALIAELRLAISLRAEKLRIKTDSRLVVGQLNGSFATKE